ncbi:receptor-type tyrosine-protein phosphatase mu-like [Protopterus annectens]|uniref:receptor-type tyrosine-protein phosphatase mu-like n=1 Tax=Protopterus annectens TaxID=7888 RepID=UPI001CFB66FC|nr:receptor-type tyrosine-protein phosphatase mu-like [Protopterus annectens]
MKSMMIAATDFIFPAMIATALLALITAVVVVVILLCHNKPKKKQDIVNNNGMNLTKMTNVQSSEIHTLQEEKSRELCSVCILPQSCTDILLDELLDHVIKLKKQIGDDDEEEEDGNSNGLAMEFSKLPVGLLHTCNAATLPENTKKNRYKNIIPYDHSRVVLQQDIDKGFGDYINASYIDGYQKPNHYIAAQGPQKHTINDFWRMVWQEKSSTIVMLTNLTEQRKVKCECYWPEQSKNYGDITVTLSMTKQAADVIIRTFTVEKCDCSSRLEVKQFHYTSWPDHHVPIKPIKIFHLLNQVHTCSSNTTQPLIIHCSAGVGRTGTFIALDYVFEMAKAEGKINVFQCVQQMREKRTKMVQTKEQYAFIYDVLLEGLICGDTYVPVQFIQSHMEFMEKDTDEANSIGYKKEFQNLETISELFKEQPCRVGQKDENQHMNRNPDILPADHVHPSLMSITSADGSPGYINAVFANTYNTKDGFIITELPLKETIPHFWALVYDYNCSAIVVMNNIQELDETYPDFWPISEESVYGDFVITLISEKEERGFRMKTLGIRNTKHQMGEWKIKHLQITNWPMKQCFPESLNTIISMLGEVDNWQQEMGDGAILVTCWDGASRSGLFCAASILCKQIQNEDAVDVLQAVRTIRASRPKILKDVKQYSLCYQLALTYLDSFENYGNFT